MGVGHGAFRGLRLGALPWLDSEGWGWGGEEAGGEVSAVFGLQEDAARHTPQMFRQGPRASRRCCRSPNAKAKAKGKAKGKAKAKAEA